MSPNEPAGSRPVSTPISRRRLLGTVAAAAAGAALPWPHRATASSSQPLAIHAPDPVYQHRFWSHVLDDPDIRFYAVPGKEFLYRPRQLLVAPDDLARVLTRLLLKYPDVHLGTGFGGVERLLFDVEVDIPTIVTALRDPDQWPHEQPPKVQPHHVMVGNPNIMGNPEGPPLYAAPTALAKPVNTNDGRGVIVGICDTGIALNASAQHKNWLVGSYTVEPGDVDTLYSGPNLLAEQAGHGTFVAGVVRQAAEGVTFDPEVALDPHGIGDESTLVAAMDGLDPRVAIINLSLGFLAMGDVPPMPEAKIMARLDPPVVVASAGNNNDVRAYWPAAAPGVIAVAALHPDPKAQYGVDRAYYSNYGAWVNVCARGDRTSTYVTGSMGTGAAFTELASWDGTSFAAPHVAGRLAKLMTDYRLKSAQFAVPYLYASGVRPPHPDCGVIVW